MTSNFEPVSSDIDERPIDELGSVAPAEPEESDKQSTTVPEILNILPLRESVIYPMLIAPLSVSRESGIAALDDAVATRDRIIGVLTQREPMMDTPTMDDLYDFGCAVIIRTLVKSADGTRLIVQGLTRFKVLEVLQTTPFIQVRVQPIEEPKIAPEKEEEVEALRRSVAAMFEQAVRLTPMLPDELKDLTNAVDEPNVMADLVAAHMFLPTEDKQRVLETVSMPERQKTLLALLSREVRVLELSSKVQNEVSHELSKSQREYYLREQLKAIQRELGEFDDVAGELDEIRERIEDSGMSAEAHKEVQREFDRLKRINPGSPEYNVARTYIDTMLAMPWKKMTEDLLDFDHVKSVLDDEHFGLEKIKDRILEFLAVRKVKTDGRVRQPILCFVGPPGVGKTSLGRSISTAIGREFVRISLGGMRDEAEIRGHRRTYIGALPGQIMQGLRRAGVKNPLFVLDEIDKLASDFRGDPASALLEVLDPEQNAHFRDHYLDTPFDLGQVFFIATANRLDTIPPALLDRMELVEIGGYTEEEKFQIARQHLIPKQVEEHGLKQSKIKFADEAVTELIRHYTRESGVRNLERMVGSVVRKATRSFAEGRKSSVTVNRAFIHKHLGAPRFLRDEVIERKLIPGMAVGLAWTPVGGDVLFIESTRMPGKGMTITGQLGDVMKESITAAMSYIRTHAKDLEIDSELISESEIHVHVPAGAVPKDGPSAGVTMLTALVSLLTGKLVKQRLAMTGEMTLTGQVLPVGGIKDKVLAAYRAGVKTLILPEDNQKDYEEEVPEEIRKQLKTHFVSNASEVLSIAINLKQVKK
ncbi:MAG: endopeptidase La [Armatimonadetes bacterium]|nr:endopeptidase La [Armatimonadota bacterium]